MPPPSASLTLKVQATYLTALRDGHKTHEGRLARPQYLALQPGNYLSIRSAGAQDTDARTFQVRSVTFYKTFRDMLAAHGIAVFLPGVVDIEEAVEVYRGFPGYAEGEVEMGVVAVEVALVGE